MLTGLSLDIMKPAVKPEDIALPDWFQRIGKERVSRTQVRLAQIHNSLLGGEDRGYAPFGEAFDTIAIELSEDPEFAERLYIPIRSAVIQIGEELGWIRADWLTPFEPMRAIPEKDWLASIVGRRPGQPWRGAYTKKWESERPSIRRKSGEAEKVDRPPLKADESLGAGEPTEMRNAKGDEADLHAAVDEFILRCNQEAPVGFKVKRKHIWRAVGHRHPRQLQYWQSGNDKATHEDDKNFRRILSMSPRNFFLLLQQKGIVLSNS